MTKSDKQDVMNVLSDIARNFDIIAVQEIRDKLKLQRKPRQNIFLVLECYYPEEEVLTWVQDAPDEL